MGSDGRWTLDTTHAAYQDLAAGEVRQVVVNYTVTDQYGASTASSLTVTVTGANDGPVAAAAAAAVLEDGSASGRVQASDADRGDSLTYALAGNAPAGLTFAADGSWSFDASGADCQALAAGETRTVTVGFSATDRAGAQSASTLTITVTGANDTPVALAAAAAVTEDETVTGHLSAHDADHGATLIYAAVGDAPAGFSLAADGSWSFDANQAEYQSLAQGETRQITAAYSVTDEHGAASLSTVTLTLTGANDRPVATSPAAEVTQGETVSGQLIGLDQDSGAQLTYAVVGETPAGLTLSPDGSWIFDAGQGTYDHLAPGEFQIVQIPYSVTDEHGATATAFMIVAVNGVNDAPALTGQAAQLPDGVEDAAYVVTQEQLLAGWTDADSAFLKARGLTVSSATVTENDDNSFTITPAANASGPLVLSYTVFDGAAETSASLTLNVAAVNDAATNFTGVGGGAIREDSATNSVTGDLGFTDVDNPNDVWRAVASPAASDLGLGTFTVNSAGQWTYKLDNRAAALQALDTGQAVVDTFTLYTQDGTARQISVTVNGRTEYVTPPVSTAPDPLDHDDHRDWMVASSPVTLTGNDSFNSFDGSNGADTLIGNGGADGLYGHGGDDRIWGDASDPAGSTVSAGADTIYGGAGNDTIYAGDRGDTVYGGSGDDLIYGNGSTAPDTGINGLYGGSGNDRIYGGENNDMIQGGTGADTLTGGAGADRFAYLQFADTGDSITDFQQGSDWIDLTGIGMSMTRWVGQIAAPDQLDPGQIGFMIVNGVTTVYVDSANTSAGIDLEIHLLGTIQLTSGDLAW
jgi:VCBS repeat-containing protein